MIFTSSPFNGSNWGAYADLSGPASGQFFNRNLLHSAPGRAGKRFRGKHGDLPPARPCLPRGFHQQTVDVGQKLRSKMSPFLVLLPHSVTPQTDGAERGVEGAGKEPHKGMEGRHQAVVARVCPSTKSPCRPARSRQADMSPAGLSSTKFLFLSFFFAVKLSAMLF